MGDTGIASIQSVALGCIGLHCPMMTAKVDLGRGSFRTHCRRDATVQHSVAIVPRHASCYIIDHIRWMDGSLDNNHSDSLEYLESLCSTQIIFHLSTVHCFDYWHLSLSVIHWHP